MKTLTNINVILFTVYLCVIAHKTHSSSIRDRQPGDAIAIDNIASLIDDYGSLENPYPQQIHPFFGKRRVDSAEKYFDWASKTNRPMEYLRGKRFWLFSKNDEHAIQHETTPRASGAPHTVKQGIWRSGIVGRRRR